MNIHRSILLLCVVCFSGVLLGGEAMTVCRREASSVAASFDCMEWIVDLDRTYENPFDPGQIAIDATFIGPRGERVALPAFWYQAHRSETDAAGEAHWLVRFAPPVPGRWQCTVTAADSKDTRTSSPISFDVAPSKNVGFVRRAPDNPRYFQFDSGESFFPVGLNLAWAPYRRGGRLAEFQSWFGKLRQGGGNFARIWMAYPGLENRSIGPGRYDLKTAWYYDRVLESAAEHGIYCMLTFDNFMAVASQWNQNPLNHANAGPATRPIDLFTLPQLRQLHQHRLRYLIARYSAYRSLGMWELFNEQDMSKLDIPASWTAEMAGYLKAHDPYRHLVTTSFAEKSPPEIWNNPAIDITQSHVYGKEGRVVDSVPVLAGLVREHGRYDKPHLIGEFGISAKHSDSTYDPNGHGTSLHNGLWSAALSGAAGGAAIWYWDNYVDSRDLWAAFQGLRRFTSAIDWPRRRFQAVAMPDVRVSFRDDENIRYGDLMLPAMGEWGAMGRSDLAVSVEEAQAVELPQYLYSIRKPDLRSPLTLSIDLPKPARMLIHVTGVYDSATLSVLVDEAAPVEFEFDAHPAPATSSTTKPVADVRRLPVPLSVKTRKDGKDFEATYEHDCVVDLPAGPHTITVQNIAGDWIKIESVTFTACKPLGLTLRPLALVDADTGETLLWLADADSNWFNDRAGHAPREFTNVALSLPVAKSGDYRVEWWDTRSGKMIRSETASVQNGSLLLHAPTFTRDIALRAVRIDKSRL